MRKPHKESQGVGEIDTDQDRYPDFAKVLRGLLNEAEIPDGPVERIEVTTLANGEATYRVWAARAEEAVGGVILDANSL